MQKDSMQKFIHFLKDSITEDRETRIVRGTAKRRPSEGLEHCIGQPVVVPGRWPGQIRYLIDTISKLQNL